MDVDEDSDQKNIPLATLDTSIWMFIRGICHMITVVNPFKPSILFVGHRQTVQAQIRRHRMCHSVTSDQDLHCLLAEYSI